MYTNIYRRNPYPAAVCLCFFRRGCPYFQYKNKVERGVKLKFSQLGASRGRGGREDPKTPARYVPSPVRGCGLEIYISLARVTWGPGWSHNGAEVSMVSWFARDNNVKGSEEIRPTIAVVFGKVVFGAISGIYRRSDLLDDSAQSDNFVVLRAGKTLVIIINVTDRFNRQAFASVPRRSAIGKLSTNGERMGPSQRCWTCWFV